MAAIVYPSTLPGPSVASIAPSERRLLSDVPGPQNVRGVQRDYLAVQQIEWAVLDSTAAAALRAWDDVTLGFSGAWFTSTWPLPVGFVAGVRRFIGRPKWQYLAGGFWRVSAQCEVRGRGLPPQSYPGRMVLDLRFHGVNAAVGPFTDECGHVVSNAGGVAFTTGTKLYGPSSGSFTGGATSSLTIPSSTDFDIGTGDFELGARAMYTSGRDAIINRRFFDNPGPGAWVLNCSSFASLTGVSDVSLGFGSVTVGTWDEYLVSRQAGVLSTFKNGALVAQIADTHSYSSTYALHLGEYNDHTTTGNLTGFLAEVWLVVGGARHTAAYTPTTAEIPTH